MKQGDTFLVCLHPFLERCTVVDSQIINNEKDFFLRVLDQALHEANENLTGERLTVNHPAHLALVGYARDHVG